MQKIGSNILFGAFRGSLKDISKRSKKKTVDSSFGKIVSVIPEIDSCDYLVKVNIFWVYYFLSLFNTYLSRERTIFVAWIIWFFKIQCDDCRPNKQRKSWDFRRKQTFNSNELLFLAYILKLGTNWNDLEWVGTTWKELKLHGATCKDMGPSKNWHKKQEIHRKKLYVQYHCPIE